MFTIQILASFVMLWAIDIIRVYEAMPMGKSYSELTNLWDTM